MILDIFWRNFQILKIWVCSSFYNINLHKNPNFQQSKCYRKISKSIFVIFYKKFQNFLKKILEFWKSEYAVVFVGPKYPYNQNFSFLGATKPKHVFLNFKNSKFCMTAILKFQNFKNSSMRCIKLAKNSQSAKISAS